MDEIRLKDPYLKHGNQSTVRAVDKLLLKDPYLCIARRIRKLKSKYVENSVYRYKYCNCRPYVLVGILRGGCLHIPYEYRYAGSLYVLGKIAFLLFPPPRHFVECIRPWYMILLYERAIARGNSKICTRSSALSHSCAATFRVLPGKELQ